MLRPVLANPGLARLGASWAAWVSAEYAALVVLSVFAYTEGGLAAVGIAAAARFLPMAVAGPWGAVLTDRYSRVQVLAAAHAVCALQLVVLGAIALLHLSLLAVFALVALGAVLSAVVRVATNALAPQVVARPEELTGANAVCSTMEAAGTLLGPALAGVLLGVVGPAFAFVAIAPLCLAGVVVTLCIRTADRADAAATPSAGGRVGELIAGFESVVRDARARDISILFIAQTCMRGLLNVFVVAAAVSLLGLGESGAGGLFSAIGLGGLLGSGLSFGMLTGRRLALPFACGVALWGLAVLAIAAWPAPCVAWIVLAGLGLGNAIEDVAGLTLLQRVIGDRHLGRALGALWGAVDASLAVGSLAAPMLIEILGLRGAMGLSGAGLVLLVLVLWSRVRQADEAVASRREPVQRRQPRRMLARLPRPSFDLVVRTLQPAPVRSGGDVLVQRR
jgi:MFS family permease